jgi:hypothetical protein
MQVEQRHDSKISTEFAERLARLGYDQTVRAVVLPAPYLVESGGARPRGTDRQAILRETRRRTEEAFAEIDAVLADRGGQRVSVGGNALGFIVVETTADGIQAICGLDWVGVVMEDQPIHLLQGPKSPGGGTTKPKT